MAEIAHWEKILISDFVVNQKKERYKALLKGRKKRRQFLELLNHNFEFNKNNLIIYPRIQLWPENTISAILKT